MLSCDADTWLIPEDVEIPQLVGALESAFTVVALPSYRARLTYADTFDWRLYRQGYFLHNHGSCWTLYHGDNGAITLQQGGPQLTTRCSAADFPTGALHDLLAPMLGVRCLLPMARLHIKGSQFRLLNEDAKTVARLVMEWQKVLDGTAAFRLVRLFGVRGYGRDFAQARTLLTQLGVTQSVSPSIGFIEACSINNRAPLDYSSKFDLQLSPENTARQAVRQIYLALLKTIRWNIPGVVADLDMEFLHDLRVAIRRTRSGLSLIKDVLPDATVVRFKNAFAGLGSLTGPTRDLDVYLQGQQSYMNRLPAQLQPGLALFFKELKKQRQVEQKKLARGIQTKKVAELLNQWQRCVEMEERQPAPRALTPVKEVGDAIIRKYYKRVLRSGLALDATTPDANVHQVRILCKKLRYSMEFFSSLYPPEALQQVVQQLKKLQDILGLFNDLSVQQDMLRRTIASFATQTPDRNRLTMAASLGALMQNLYQEQQALRAHFTEAFAQFADEQTTELCRQLFSKQQEAL